MDGAGKGCRSYTQFGVKFEITNPKSETNSNFQKMQKEEKYYDLEERTFKFASEVRVLVNALTKTIANIEDGKQATRSSGSPGANYIEANERLGKKDFLMKIKICRKEAKESRYWLRLLNNATNIQFKEQLEKLTQEAMELTMIFSSIMRKSS